MPIDISTKKLYWQYVMHIDECNINNCKPCSIQVPIGRSPTHNVRTYVTHPSPILWLIDEGAHREIRISIHIACSQTRTSNSHLNQYTLSSVGYIYTYIYIHAYLYIYIYIYFFYIYISVQ